MKTTEEAEGWTGKLVLDAGDLFVEPFTIPEERRKAIEATAEFLVQQVGDIGCQGMAVGDRDLLLGLEVLRKLERKAKFPFLSANLVDPKTGQRLFRARFVQEVAGVKVGVFGLTTRQTAWRGEGEPQWKIDDFVPAATEQVAALKAEGAAVIVALAHLSDVEVTELTEKVPGITAILGGHTQRMMQHPDQLGGTFFAEAFSKGKLISNLVLHVWKGQAASSGFIDRYKKQGLQSRVAELEGQITSYERMLSQRKELDEAKKLAGDAPEPQDVRKRRLPDVNTSFYEQQLVKLRADKQLLELELEDAVEPDPKANFVRYSTVQLSRSIEDDPKVHAAVEAFRKKYPKAAGGH